MAARSILSSSQRPIRYDTVIAAGGLSDHELAARCAGEDRILLTKDRHLAATATGVAPVVLVQGNGIDETARGLRAALDIDWQYAPFTRCMVDNRPLDAAPANLANHVPERSRSAGGPLRMCPETSAFLDGMVEQVKPDQPGIEVSVVHRSGNA